MNRRQQDAEWGALMRSVATWPTAQRQVFTLRKVYGLRPCDIARTLGLSAAEVERHLIAAALACGRHLASARDCGEPPEERAT